MEVSVKKLGILVVAAPLALAACEGGTGIGGMGTKQTIGAGGGAVAGGLVGSQIGSGTGQLIATGAGVLLGALVGSEVGKSLDRADRAQAESAFNRASTAPVGQTVSWNNPDSGNRGTVTPIREGTANDGRPCREYQTTVYVDGRYEEARGTACRNYDGTWEVVS